MVPTSNDPAIQFLLDREAIRDVLHNYCRAIDRCDRQLLETTYWPDGTDDHNIFIGSAPDYIDFILKWREALDQTHHNLGNVYINNDGDTAKCESYFTAFHRMNDESGKMIDLVVGGRYLDRMQKRDGEWRFFHRKGIVDWYRFYEESADWEAGIFGTKMVPGARKPDDLVYGLFGIEGR